MTDFTIFIPIKNNSIDFSALWDDDSNMEQNLMPVTIQQMQVFLTVAETGGFLKAGEKLHLTQSAVSKNIARLEAALGFPLFLRSTRKIELTSAGQVLYDAWRPELLLLYAGYRNASALNTVSGNLLRIGLINTVLPEVYFLELQSRFQSAFPEVKLTFGTGYITELEERLVSGDYDLITLPDFERFWVENEHLASAFIAKKPACILVSKNHPIASRDTLLLSDILDEDFIILKRDANNFYMRDLEERFARFDAEPRVVSHFVSGHDMKFLFRTNQTALTFLDSFFDFPESPEIKRIPILDQENGILLVWNPKRKDPALLDFLSVVN